MRIVLSISGGIIRCAYHVEGETQGEVPDIVVMDHDVEGTAEEDLARIPEEGVMEAGVMKRGDGNDFVDVYTVDAVNTDPDFFETMYNAEQGEWTCE